jgi:hypothetical protein
MSDEVVSFTGTVLAVRGPFFDGSAEIDFRKEDGEVVVIAVDAEMYAEIMNFVGTEIEPN